MIVLSRFWGWWTDTWRTPGRARLLYGVMAIGFGAVAVAGAVQSDALVAALGALGALVTIGLAVIAPRLSRWTGPPVAEQGDPWKTN